MKLSQILQLNYKKILNFMLNFYLKSIQNKSLSNLILTESSVVSTHNTELLFELIKCGFEMNKNDFVSLLKIDSDENQFSIFSYLTMQILNGIVSLFPRIPKEFLLKVGPILLVLFLLIYKLDA